MAAEAAEEPKLDIKDFILIGGGLLIAAVVAHGFWIAWRARRDPLRLDIVPDLVSDDVDDLVRLRSELPNGGGRIVRWAAGTPEQANLGLDEHEAILLEPLQRSKGEGMAPERAGGAHEGSGRAGPVLAEKRQEPRFPVPGSAPAGAAADPGETAAADTGTAKGRVADVIMPDARIVADDPTEARRRPGRRVGGSRQRGSEEPTEPGARSGGRARASDRQDPRDKRGRSRAAAGGEPVIQELIVINVVAPRGQHFEGPALVEGLRARGLRYGEMNIFHRVDPMTRAVAYSVANVLEPGTFDMSDIENFRSPGVCFFMQLPGPEDPLEAFEDMLKAARNLALQLGGELKDEQRSVMTGQTVEHYRQRIAEFRRRLMSMRA